MKTTGIVRRIDELGRLVIPKEMRKRFHLLEGDSVEFYVNDEQEIVIRKYSVIQPWEQVSQKILNTLAKHTQNPVYLMNNESLIQASRDIYQEDLHKKLHEQFLKNTIVYTNQQFSNILLFENEDRVVSGFVFPIVIHGDWLASFVLFESRETITENDIRIMDAFRNYFVHTIEE